MSLDFPVLVRESLRMFFFIACFTPSAGLRSEPQCRPTRAEPLLLRRAMKAGRGIVRAWISRPAGVARSPGQARSARCQSSEFLRFGGPTPVARHFSDAENQKTLQWRIQTRSATTPCAPIPSVFVPRRERFARKQAVSPCPMQGRILWVSLLRSRYTLLPAQQPRDSRTNQQIGND